MCHWFLICAGLGLNFGIWYFLCINDWRESSDQCPLHRHYLIRALLSLIYLVTFFAIPIKAFQHFEAPWGFLSAFGLLALMWLFYREVFSRTCEAAICRRLVALKNLRQDDHVLFASLSDVELRREAELYILAIAKQNNVFDDDEETSEEQLEQEAAK